MMAPVLPALQAFLLALGGIKLTVLLVALLQDLTLIFTGWLVMWRGGHDAARRRVPVIACILYFETTWSNFSNCYQYTHDAWLVMLLVGVLVYVADRLWARSIGWRSALGWGLLGGLAALASPALGLPWLALSVLLGRSSRQIRPAFASISLPSP